MDTKETASETSFPKPGPCWLEAPGELSPRFLPAFARVSSAVQLTLRRKVPPAYFEKLENFEDVKRAWPMLVYHASEPFRCRIRTDLTYDVLNPRTINSLLRSAKLGLPDLLAQVENRLTAAGLSALAGRYLPRRAPSIIEAVQKLAKSRKYLYLLVRAEGILVDSLIELGGLGSLPPRQQARTVAAFQKKWAYQLKRLYPGTDCLWLAPALLDEATAALERYLEESKNAPGEASAEPELLDESQLP